MNQKEYKVYPAANGFIVRFEHLDKAYDEENPRVAKTLTEVAEIIGNDLKAEKSAKN